MPNETFFLSPYSFFYSVCKIEEYLPRIFRPAVQPVV